MRVRRWSVAYHKDGFYIRVEDARWVGVALEWLLDRDPCWWGEHKNLPFCLINPWGWTWHVGWGERTLGAAWSATGQWLCQVAWRLQDERQVVRLPISNEVARRLEPRFFDDMASLDEGDETMGESR